jgi:hypothetical protein
MQRADENAGGGPPTPLDEAGEIVVQPPVARPILPEKPAIRKLLVKLMTFVVIGPFICAAIQYLWRDSEADRADFSHLFELILVLYGGILGCYSWVKTD